MTTTNKPLLDGLVMRPHHTALCVDDFEAARAFFTELIGMRVEGEMDQRGEPELGLVVGLPGALIRWAMLELQGYRVELFKYYRPHDGRRIGLRQCDRALTHIAFQVSDADETYARLRAAGVETYSAPQNLRGGRTRPFYAVGPEGIAVEFIQLRDAAELPAAA
ncbi:MAG: VOC family protein [Proteobacteria bacterium]|nr:VOC family protein [Pseudomonadota bacterium]